MYTEKQDIIEEHAIDAIDATRAKANNPIAYQY